MGMVAAAVLSGLLLQSGLLFGTPKGDVHYEMYPAQVKAGDRVTLGWSWTLKPRYPTDVCFLFVAMGFPLYSYVPCGTFWNFRDLIWSFTSADLFDYHGIHRAAYRMTFRIPNDPYFIGQDLTIQLFLVPVTHRDCSDIHWSHALWYVIGW